jgi:hypothetical protein
MSSTITFWLIQRIAPTVHALFWYLSLATTVLHSSVNGSLYAGREAGAEVEVAAGSGCLTAAYLQDTFCKQLAIDFADANGACPRKRACQSLSCAIPPARCLPALLCGSHGPRRPCPGGCPPQLQHSPAYLPVVPSRRWPSSPCHHCHHHRLGLCSSHHCLGLPDHHLPRANRLYPSCHRNVQSVFVLRWQGGLEGVGSSRRCLCPLSI